MKKLYYSVAVLIIFSCNNDNENSVRVTKPEYDTSGSANVKYVKPGGSVFSGIDSSLFSKETDERLKRRMIVYMSIDSTYYAINAIEEVKNEMAANSSVSLSVSERNLKSKAILKLNAIQNCLSRQVDSVLLTNLKMHTDELASINSSISGDVAHLKNVSQLLSKVSAIMGRVTNVLTFCISRGVIKPPTPINKQPDQVKSSVN